MNVRRIALIAALLYGLFLILTIPASTAVERLAARGIVASGVSGALWRGNMTQLRAGVLNLGNVEWRVRFLHLLMGQLTIDINARPENGYAQGRIAIGLTGTITLSDVSTSLPLQTLLGTGGLPGGWVGTAQAHFESVKLVDRWPVAATGTLDVIHLSGPSNAPSDIGAYRFTFPAAGSGSDQALTGALQSQADAALDVLGTLTLKPDRTYQLDTRIAARNAAPASLADSLAVLGSPDADGRRQFSLAGSF